MKTLGKSSFLRRILLVDALVSGAAGLVMALAAGPLEERLGVPAALLRFAGWSLIPFSIGLAFLAGWNAVSRGAVLAVIVLNAAWVAASVLVLVAGAIQPTLLGYAFVVGQAAAVAVLAEMETVGLKRASGTAGLS